MSIARNTLLLVVSIGLALGLAEHLIRQFQPQFSLNPAGLMTHLTNHSATFEVDSAYGYRPILGTIRYNKYGTRPNRYKLEKLVGITRLLFIGDSVTNRERLLPS